jgi:hypothetical protein|tara:strand:+ start:76 stop:534 length:459 start_codon:yes stop_codon:yes gene_type:complete
MAELLTDDIITDALSDDGIMEEPDANWLLEYINTEYGGSLDNTSDWCDDKHKLKIYSETTADSYEIYFCTHEEKPYVSQDGYYYEDHSEWSEQAIGELTSGSDVWIAPEVWSDMEYDFNYELEQWWPDVYEEKFNDKKDELLDSDDYYYEEE